MANQKQIIEGLVFGIMFLVLVTTGLILFFYYSRRKIIEKEIEKVNIKLDHQKQILQNTINVQEDERNRIAQDLHDAISSKLNVVTLTTNVLIDDDEIQPKHRDSLNHILDITTKTLESSRKIAHELMPPVLYKFGLKVALEELFDEFTSNSELQINHEIDTIDLSQNDALHIFRIVQELINNALVHGKADELEIVLNKLPEVGFSLLFKDNGVGFNVNAKSKKSGIGLQNIKSRVAILNGQLVVESSKQLGSKFKIHCYSYG
ncbi:MAG: sensor histidine kinase [Psychroserpens sp.]|nr:sensor histidine kinase [Psychroserpens sp.]MBO6631823.1 sensor histidine kinase [Psychroserpens sp.]MBO6653554.1 sensor histidine kinase [Psychroserpens sp.]MBO6681875.1 sensor histidine kinase [Psychroserpens sp.]MBO6749011.1 sensor histidine kinase [Psychroserpens sp.]